MKMPAKKQAGVLIFAGLFLFVLNGCAFSLHEIPQPLLEPQQVSLKNVPFYPQEQYHCGPASLAMVLGWSGIAVQPDELVQEVYSPGRRGSLQPDLISAVRRHGRVAYPISGTKTLTAELAAGHPVIVLLNLGFFWYPKWHYAVVVGYDQPAGEIILHSGNIQNERLSFRVFDNLWARSERWGLLVLPPSQFPAEIQKDTWLEAVVGLELAKQWPAAITAYEMTITQWPESYSAWIGLGNSRYAFGDLAGAASAFRQASRLNQKNGIAFNNLAQVLWEMGQPAEALAAARQAIILGGPLLEKFRQTLYEIETRPKR
jgi:hypothetical protein